MQGYGITLGVENAVNALFSASDGLLGSFSHHPNSLQVLPSPHTVHSRYALALLFKDEFGQCSLYSQSQCSDAPSMWTHLQLSLCSMTYSSQGRLVG